MGGLPVANSAQKDNSIPAIYSAGPDGNFTAPYDYIGAIEPIDKDSVV